MCCSYFRSDMKRIKWQKITSGASQVVKLILDLLVLDGNVDEENFICCCHVQQTGFGCLKFFLSVITINRFIHTSIESRIKICVTYSRLLLEFQMSLTTLNASPVIGATSSGSMSNLILVPLSLETSPLSKSRAPLLKPTERRVRLSLTQIEVGEDDPRPFTLRRVVRTRDGLPFLSGLS